MSLRQKFMRGLSIKILGALESTFRQAAVADNASRQCGALRCHIQLISAAAKVQ
jgi:hypothetical protein